MYGQPQSSMYPKIGAGASPRNPPFQPAPNPPSSGTEPEYRITPPPQLLPQVGEVPRSNFHFDFEFERNVLAEAVKENPNWARLGIDIVPPKATQPNSSPYGPTADPVVSKYTSAGLNRDAVALAIENYGDNPTKKERKRGGMEEEEGRAEFEASREIEYVSYSGEHHLPLIMDLVDQELSEPYSIFTYRYFVYQWPNLSFLAFHNGKCVGTVVSKMGDHRHTFRGYIAMLVVLNPYRGKGIATELVARSVKVMMESGCEEVTLEAEVTNKGALALYGRLGFIRAKRLFRYYLNGVDAFRLKLMFPRLQPNYYTGIGNQAHPDENYEINNKSQ